MKILLVHNFYQQSGGEDQVFYEEQKLLEDYGHQVIKYTLHNDEVNTYSQVKLAQILIWNQVAYRELRSIMLTQKPSVMHVHNTFPLISPASYYAAHAEAIPIVQTLHNYRLLCANALFFREGNACEDCVGKGFPWPSVAHGCYRNSRVASAGIAMMLSTHRVLKTWQKKVNLYIALSDFAKKKFITGGLPEDKIVVKPNFIFPDPGSGKVGGEYAIYVGRLSGEKGVETMLKAWERSGIRLPLKIVGEGPLASQVKHVAEKNSCVDYLGYQSHDNVLVLMKNALMLIFPSECYENFPLTIVEAYAVGLPVIACKNGTMSSLVIDGKTGLHFALGNAADLAIKIRWVLDNPDERTMMGVAARREYCEKYTAERNYRILIDSYNRVLTA